MIDTAGAFRSLRPVGPQGESTFGMDPFVSWRFDDEDPEVARGELSHAHLPKVADLGYINWDPDAEMVRRGAKFGDVAPVFELLGSHNERVRVDSS